MLKRLEIQCVFKELVKDIVVKGHSPRHLPLYGIMSGAYYFVGEVFIPSWVHCASCRKIKSENLRRALRCHAVRSADVRPGTVK